MSTFKNVLAVMFLALSATAFADAPPPAEIAPVQAGGTAIKLSLDPQHPTRKQDTTLTVAFTDASTGKGVDVEGVEIQWAMDGKKHAAKIKAKRTTETGVYQAKTIAPMNGMHNLVVTAIRDGEPIAATFETHVMDLTRGMKDTMGH